MDNRECEGLIVLIYWLANGTLKSICHEGFVRNSISPVCF